MSGHSSVSFFTHNRYDPSTGCWNWTGHKNNQGYGVIRYDGGPKLVHRIAAHCWLNLDLASKLFVLHECDNPLCFNPQHLFVGTQTDNMRDSLKKGRNYRMNLTHCPNGHPYSGRNLQLAPKGRICRICKNQQNRIYQMRFIERQKDGPD